MINTKNLNVVAIPVVGGLSLVILSRLLSSRRSTLREIPTIGPSFPGLSYAGAARLLLDSASVIQEGYDKYKESIFKVADFKSWVIFVSHPKHLEDIRKAAPEVLGFDAAIDQALHALAPKIRRSHLHVPIVQNQLTRELTTSFSNIDEEVTLAMDQRLKSIDENWKPISTLDLALEVVTRTTHRMFIGLPLCRDPGYVKFTRDFAMDISRAASFIRFFPYWVRGLVGSPYANVNLAVSRMAEYIRPLYDERKRNIEQFGADDAGNPEDLLSWFMEVVDGETEEQKLIHVAYHILTLDFGAVATTSTSWTQAIHHLAAHPELQAPMREEVEAVIAKHGWTKNALGEMKKMDSFFKESQRVTGLAAVSTYRRVLKPFAFSDGLEVPVGTTIAVTAHCTHMDDSIYPNAETFNAFRFVGKDDENSLFVTPSPNYLPFGMGRHTCPGRFFTITVMKTIMAHFLLEYEVKARETSASVPSGSWFALDMLPSAAEDILIRRRDDQVD